MVSRLFFRLVTKVEGHLICEIDVPNLRSDRK